MANSVYDPEQQPDDNSFEPRTIHKNPAKPSEGNDDAHDDLRRAESGASTGTAGGFNFNPKGDREKKGGGAAATGLAAAELSAGIATGNPATFARGAKNFFWGSKKRKRATVGSSIGGVVVGGGVFVIVLLSGPAQLVQLSHMLQKNFTGTNNTSSSRANVILRSAGAQDLGETRVGIIQRQYLRSSLANLSELGIDLRANRVGGFEGGTIDAKKLANKYPALENMSPEEQKAWIADRLKIPVGKISIRGGAYSINGADFSIRETRGLLGNVVSLDDNGPAISAANKRLLRIYFGADSLFHPFSKALQQKLNNADTALKKKQAFEDDQKSQAEPIEAKAAAAEEHTKSEASKTNSFTTRALTYTSGVCFVRSTADDLITINRYRVVLPAAVAAVSFIAIGSQIQSGQDVSMKEAGAATDSLTNAQGQNVWQGQALQVTAGTPSPSGPDLSSDYRQAFSNKTTASRITDIANTSLGGAAVAGAACSTLGTVVQVVVSLAQYVASAGAEIATDGAVSPLVYGSLVARFTESAAFQAVGMHFLQQFILSKTATGTLAKDAFSGPVGGNLLAYGAREAANIGSIAEGGIALTGSETSKLAVQQQQHDQQQFRSESFFARTFDIYDYRSLAGRLADSIRPSYTANVASAVGGFQNIGGSLLGNLSSIFLPKSQAANQYDWGFPEYNIPKQLLNDADLSDVPKYQRELTPVLDSSVGQQYIDKSMTCFGNKVSKDSGVWDIQHDHDVNPQDQDYIDANCNSLSDPIWNRMIMFNVDTFTADAMACFKFNDDTACTAIGFGQSSGPSSPTPIGAGGLTNPFPGGWTPGRLDMGYDGTFKNQIVAPFSGTITYASTSFSNWGGYIELKADQQPAGLPTSTLYFAEGVKPAAGITAGKHVNAGDPIADAYTNGAQGGIPGLIEWGVAQDGSVGTPTNTYVYGQCGSSAAKSTVLSFSQWAQSLGLGPPSDTSSAGCP